MLCRVKDEDEVHEHYLPISSSATLDLQHLSLHLQTGGQDLCSLEVFRERPLEELVW